MCFAFLRKVKSTAKLRKLYYIRKKKGVKNFFLSLLFAKMNENLIFY